MKRRKASGIRRQAKGWGQGAGGEERREGSGEKGVNIYDLRKSAKSAGNIFLSLRFRR